MDYSIYALFALPVGEVTLDELLAEMDEEIVKLQENLISEKDFQKLQNKFENKYFYGKEYRVTKSLKNKFQIKIDGKKYLYTQPSLNGKHQIENASISIYFAKTMKKMGYKLITKEINAAIKKRNE